jgi:hypothetical protein
MVANVPDRLTDLLQIACYVHCADQFASRGGLRMRRMGADWRRRFRFRVPVRDLSFWSRPAVLDCLQETLSFLSDDDYAFEFFENREAMGLAPYLDLESEGGLLPV